MLSQSRVLNYIKEELGFPYIAIELTDTEILEFITTYTLREFSYYIPDIVTIGYNLQLASNKVPGKANEFYISDEQGLEILNVKDVIFTQSSYYMFGHPPLGPMSLGELSQWALNVEVAGMIKQFSSWDYTFEFKQPNIIRISPTPNSEKYVAIEYERVHPPDLGRIPNDLQMMFCELALADIMIRLGRIRKKYSDGNLKTPFGDIPINAEIGEEGKDKREKIIDKLSTGIMTNVILDIG